MKTLKRILAALSAFSISFAAFAQQGNVSLHLNNVSIEEAISIFQKQSGYSVLVRTATMIDMSQKVTMNVDNVSPEKALSMILQGGNLSFSVKDSIIIVSESSSAQPASGQTKTPQQLSGTVTDPSGQPCVGAAVVVRGTGAYAITDLDGKFTLPAQKEAYTLDVTYIGFKDLSVAGTPADSNLALVMEEDSKLLDEAVIVGYGTQRRELLTNAISKFKPNDDNSRQALSPSELLQGRVAGMTVSTQSGNLGTAERVSIRGSASLNASNEPLYVIDGIPLNNETGSLYSYGEDLSSLSVLNLTDIESIEVLKDAASAAIYGSRATNGVILITTKSGREGKSETKVNYNTGVNLFPNRHRIVYADADSWVNVYNTAIDNYNAQMGYGIEDASFVRPIMNPYESLGTTDWLAQITRPGIFHNADLSFSGGTSKTSFYVGAAYRFEQGTMISNDIQKANIKANVSHKMKPWLKIGANLSGNFLHNNRVPGANLGSTIIARAVEQRPFDRFFKPSGDYYVGGTDELSRHNAAQLVGESTSYVDNYRFLGSAYADINLHKKVSLKLSYSTDVTYTLDYIYYNANHPYCEDHGRIIEKNRLLMTNLAEGVLNYGDKFLNDNIDFSVMAGASFQKTNMRNDSIDVQNFPSPSYNTVGSASVFSGVSGGVYEYAIASYFGRATLSYKDRYVLNATLRSDGSSRFAPSLRWGIFPSVSVGWNVSKENFWNLRGYDLKIRASYGKTGNQDGISNYAWQALISSGANYNGQSGIAASTNGNPNLTWETADQYDAGFDFNLLKGKINIIFDAYLKNTNNLLYKMPTPSTTGFTSILSNIGSMRNYGIEFTLDTHLDLGPVQWNSSFNLTHNRNRLTRLLNDEIISLNSFHALKVGEEVGVFYMYRFDGIYQYDGEVPEPLYELGVRAGDVKYHDVNGDGLINDKDRMLCGSANPSLSGGWSNTFKYKGFEFGIFFTYMYGNKVYAQWMSGPTRLGNYQGLLKEWADHYWTGPGSTNSYPRPIYSYHGQNNSVSTRYLMDGSNIRLSSLNIGYSFPSKLTESMRINALRIYLQGENLCLLSKYPGWDPEISTSVDPSLIGVDNYGVPRSKVFKLGISLTF